VTSNGYANADVLISTDEVARRLNDGSFKLVEVDVDTAAFDEGHIPGAVPWNWTTQLGDQVRRDIPDPDVFARLLGSSGISHDDTIVLYGDNNNWFAAFAYWLLRLNGHQRLRLMNGGRKKWLAEGRPITKDATAVTPVTYTINTRDLSLRVLQPEVRARLGEVPDGKLGLVDVRSPAEFTGEILAPPGLGETAQRSGHIPGAANIPWAQAVEEDGTFKDADALRALYAGKGITPNKNIITYCRIGERSSHSWFVLHELLGYPSVRNYDGSWTEWGSMIGRPIER
jgi:thiosulfate/3-mercaptopyruvate sulfurtransferase